MQRGEGDLVAAFSYTQMDQMADLDEGVKACRRIRSVCSK